ncbi:MAG: hypothetical protein IPO45_13475 [Saprospiraceae bacterium]|jgi:hypothetical protein|uniref:hypothetical protein n=1 Tax=Candidatus Brachybacter algidus TaxID=2982024 RepID=UPI001B4EEB50|nr:hypothetical protein [Candidatus Brachybacter algidus]MBP7304548.1 hypothetical protein [Saprospiraceae bacterium]MBK6372377.1 hypothetical protein [Candidatus Brachybacter algidus]MBK6450200.1 hypothetical protein [Candidatus Brachybacter algidus]MBK7603219.1 hypothetical protein [Candidatus Brachybacter algidus]MBK8604095.1 hypothetical protein [Candidatus Brachybacter algidus]
MQFKYIITLIFCLNIFLACNTSRKTMVASSVPEPDEKKETTAVKQLSKPEEKPTEPAPTILSGMSILSPAANQGLPTFVIPYEVVSAPGEKQLMAMQEKYQGITIETLRLGHELFNVTCTGCHEQKSIYARTEESWHIIVDDMAMLAELNDIEKDAVMKYVLSVKATQNSTKIDE